jgi:hypothetical protein
MGTDASGSTSTDPARPNLSIRRGDSRRVPDRR